MCVLFSSSLGRIPIADIFLTKKKRRKRRRRRRRKRESSVLVGESRFGALTVGTTITVASAEKEEEEEEEPFTKSPRLIVTSTEKVREASSTTTIPTTSPTTTTTTTTTKTTTSRDEGKIPSMIKAVLARTSKESRAEAGEGDKAGDDNESTTSKALPPRVLSVLESMLGDSAKTAGASGGGAPLSKQGGGVASLEFGAGEESSNVENATENATEEDADGEQEFGAGDGGENPWGEYEDDVYDYLDDYYDDEEEELEEDDDKFKESGEDEEEDELLRDLPPEVYCDLVNTLNEKCLESSILEIWKFSEKKVAALTRQKIIDDVNEFRERWFQQQKGNNINYYLEIFPARCTATSSTTPLCWGLSRGTPAATSSPRDLPSTRGWAGSTRRPS